MATLRAGRGLLLKAGRRERETQRGDRGKMASFKKTPPETREAGMERGKKNGRVKCHLGREREGELR